MPTATRGAAGLILLGALLAQAPLAAARVPQEPSGPADSTASLADCRPTTLPSTADPTIAPDPDRPPDRQVAGC